MTMTIFVIDNRQDTDPFLFSFHHIDNTRLTTEFAGQTVRRIFAGTLNKRKTH